MTRREIVMICQSSRSSRLQRCCRTPISRTTSMSLVRDAPICCSQTPHHSCAYSCVSNCCDRPGSPLSAPPMTAPMVRYSKLPARMLFASYNTHITYAPMILAREFVRSAKARHADFTTSTHERGIFHFPLPSGSGSGGSRGSAPDPARTYDPARALGHMSARLNAHAEDLESDDTQPGSYRRVRGALIAQFAARSAKEFADAVEVVSPYVDGVDLNCGWSVACASRGRHLEATLTRIHPPRELRLLSASAVRSLGHTKVGC